MNGLPKAAKIYLALVAALGAVAATSVYFLPFPRHNYNWFDFALFAALAVIGSNRKVVVFRRGEDEDTGSMSLGFAVTFATMIHCGIREAMVVAGIGSLVGCFFPKRQKTVQMTFNFSLSLFETLLGGLVYFGLNAWSFNFAVPSTFLAVVGSSLTFYLINTFGVATIISLVSGQRLWNLWKENFLWTAPSFFAGACISTLTLFLIGKNIFVVLLFMAPVLFFVYQSYATYMARSMEKQRHIEELQRKQEQLAELYLATIKSLALAIDAKDQYTHQHILRVQRYSVAIAKEMGLEGNDLEAVNTGALLHDIGKLGVPEYVLLKPGRLTDEEFAKIKAHPEIGAAILEPVEFPWPVLPVVRHHHEKFDGTGYPDGLAGEEIPLSARIMAVADVYDALTSNRSYRSAWTHERAVETIKNDAGTHFDPQVVEAFVRIIDGVVQEMAEEGEGPLVDQNQVPSDPKSRIADKAARDISRSSAELWALYEVAQTLSSSLGLDETIAILGRKLEAIFPGATCVFLLRDDESKGYRARAVLGTNVPFFTDCSTNGDQSLTKRMIESNSSYLGEYDQDDLMLTGSGSSVWVPMKSSLIVPIVHQEEALGSINLYHAEPGALSKDDQSLLEMIAERAAMAIYNGLLFDRTRGHAFTDSLTGLYNLRFVTQYVEDKVRMGHRIFSEDDAFVPTERFALLCLDLDSFKPINDNFGHQKGDKVLVDLAEIFKQTVRDNDIVARYGGDEFLIILQNAGPESAEIVMEKLQKAVEEFDPGLIHYKLGNLRVGVSVGYACYPEDGDSFATLVNAADHRMYERKTERKLASLTQKGGKKKSAS